MPINPVRSSRRLWATSLRPSTSLPSLRPQTLRLSNVADGPKNSSENEATERQALNSKKNTDRARIYVLGLGNIGLFVAHAISLSTNPPPITLLTHHASHSSKFINASARIELRHLDGTTSSSSNYSVEFIRTNYATGDIAEAAHRPIINLIVATKAYSVTNALNFIQDRLSPKSTILFVQNGMGTIDEVIKRFFPNEHQRPALLSAVLSHGIYSSSPFRLVQGGEGSVGLGLAGLQNHSKLQQTRYLVSEILRASLLNAYELGCDRLLCLQLQKVVVNSVINPLTAILDCKNGELLDKPEVLRLMRALVHEASHVINAMPEIERNSFASRNFSREVLEEKVLGIARLTGWNMSSMLQDVRSASRTEDEYINGWIVNKGLELGVGCPTHEKVRELLSLRQSGRSFSVQEVMKKFSKVVNTDI